MLDVLVFQILLVLALQDLGWFIADLKSAAKRRNRDWKVLFIPAIVGMLHVSFSNCRHLEGLTVDDYIEVTSQLGRQ